MAVKMVRRYKLLPGSEEDLEQAANLVLASLMDKSEGYRITAAKNAMLRELSNWLPSGLSDLESKKEKVPVSFSSFPPSMDVSGEEEDDCIGFLEEDRLHAKLKDMDQRHRIIVEMKYGLNGADVHSVDSIAFKLGDHAQTVRCLLAEALEMLGETWK